MVRSCPKQPSPPAVAQGRRTLSRASEGAFVASVIFKNDSNQLVTPIGSHHFRQERTVKSSPIVPSTLPTDY
jgi:hypothetical protein